MGKLTGFLEFTRELPTRRSPQERVNDYKEFIEMYPDIKLEQQSSRCMNCGIPFCHHGCPLGNIIPEFNDAVYHKSWKEAYDILSSLQLTSYFTNTSRETNKTTLGYTIAPRSWRFSLTFFSA